MQRRNPPGPCAFNVSRPQIRRFTDGIAKDLAAFLPSCATMLRALRRDPRIPRRAKAAVAIAAALGRFADRSDPEFPPAIGPLDDIVVVALALRYAARRIPPEALTDAWPAERRILERLAPATAQISPDDRTP